MATLRLVPLVFAVATLLVVAATPLSEGLRTYATRLAIPVFGNWVSRDRGRRTRQVRRMRAAHVTETHRAFAARTILLSGMLGVVGGVLGVYAIAWLLEVLAVTPERLRTSLPEQLSFLAGVARLSTVGPLELFGLLLVGSATLGAVLAAGFYWARWSYLDQLATARDNAIEATLPRTVAFIYALSRSGMSFPQVLDTLTRNRAVYGEAATEVGVAVRDMQTFGTDVLTALQRVSGRTPSENMSEFTENLSSVLGSGRSLSNFLRDQYERYQEQAEAQQEQYLDLLSTFAEIYVTVLVAGPLFFITVLVVVGLVLSDTLPVLRFLTYAGIPLASAGFVVYIDSITQEDGAVEATVEETDPGELARRAPDGSASDGRVASDGGMTRDGRATGGNTGGPFETGAEASTSPGPDRARTRRNRRRLRAYERIQPLRGWVREPFRMLARRPEATLLLTVPAGVAWLLVRSGDELARRLRDLLAGGLAGVGVPGPGGLLAALDGPLVEWLLVVMGAYALVYEVGKRRTRSLEDAIPDLLDRMASVNEAGMTVVESIERVSDNDVGPLNEELRRTCRDIEWGADAATALRRLDERTNVPTITRAVTLITNAMAASGDVAPVLRIAADEAEQSRRLRRARRQEMLTYLLVIYVSFLVFLGIIGALTISFIPAIEEAAAGTATATSAGVSAGPFSGLEDVNTASYELLFFHVSAIQAVCSGMIAGQLGEGSVRDGVKHAGLLLAVAYVAFAVVL